MAHTETAHVVADAPPVMRTAPRPSAARLNLATVSVLVSRDLRRFFRQRSRVIGALVQPLIFWAVIGSGLQGSFRMPGTGSGDYTEGAVDVVRGTVDPIAGRHFAVQRGRVQFTGGPPSAALLDVEATYDNPVAKVTVTVAGPLSKPEVKLSSQPPLDDAQIAMLIATGQTELKPGAGGVGTLSGEEAGKAALAALATQAFKNLVANKLPLDTVALDSGALRAGKYVTDRIYVGYTRKFSADPAKGENEDELRVEYKISPGWTFESRYGNAQAGGASLVWSRNY